MIEQLKIMLGASADNFTDAQIELALKLSVAEVEAYCNRDMDTALELVAMQIAKIKLYRLDTEGLTSQSLSGISESYLNDYPEGIKAILNRKRKVKVI